MEDQGLSERNSSAPRSKKSAGALPAGVQIRVDPGFCYVESAALFTPSGDDLIRRFIDGLFRNPAVSMVNVDREHATVGIRFDHRRNDPRNVLQDIAAGLLSKSDGNDESVFRSFLARIPGRVHRVERQLQLGNELFTVASDGDGFVARSQQCLGKMTLVSDHETEVRTANPGEQAGSVADRVFVIAQEIIVEYDGDLAPAQVETLEAETQAGGVVILGARSAVRQLHGRRLQVLENALRYGRRLAQLSAELGRDSVSWLEAKTPAGAVKWFALVVDGRSRGGPSGPNQFPASGSRGEPWGWVGNTNSAVMSTKLRVLAAAFAILGVSLVIAGPAGPMLILLGAMGAVAVLRLPTLQFVRIAGGQMTATA